ncbi:unnamed protein product [Hydatigera taeniaeformis]|uniref:COesterase domain-containing protein n=1 Tax=Hydatigena taeniaeformis TaxID=6205 RepID=A0A0R3WJ44_HYDTA|nr:unnamed protein product [Hydatigera taeniaeformis]
MTNPVQVADCAGEKETGLQFSEPTECKTTSEGIAISDLSKRPYLSVSALLPSPTEWHERWHVRNRKRFRILRLLWFTFAAVNLSHLIILLGSLIYNLYVNWWVEVHKLPMTDEHHGDGLLYYETSCVAIYPEHTGQGDWYLLDFLPYAALPNKRAVFAMPVQITTFQECYNAFWLGVHPSKRQFVNGQLRFLGKRADLSCLQLGRSEVNETATVANCLTVSFHFRVGSATNFTGLKQWGSISDPKPIVAYIGGRGLLYHRPQIIPLSIAEELDVLYVVIRYRLGVFGFGDFGTPNYGPNHGVEDVRKALQWLYENARLFGGSPNTMTVIGEDSGASIALAVSGDRYISEGNTNSTQVSIIFKMPEIPSEKRPFHSLVLSDIELLAACRRWQSENEGLSSGGGSSTLANRIRCLEESVSETTWLERTPGVWLHADERMTMLPHKAEEEELMASLLLADPQVSRVVSPLKLLTTRDLPLVWLSSLYHPYPPPPKALSLKDFKNMIKSTFSKFSSVNTRRKYDEELLSAYGPMLKAAQKNTSKTPYSQIVNAIITDLRAVCGVDLYLRRLMRMSMIQQSPIYRILSEAEPTTLEEKTVGRPYSMPPFLVGQRQTDQRPDYPSEFLRRAFATFLQKGRVESMKELHYPRNINDPDLETTFNILGPVGLTTASARVIAHFAACKAWISEKDETEFAIKYGRLN